MLGELARGRPHLLRSPTAEQRKEWGDLGGPLTLWGPPTQDRPRLVVRPGEAGLGRPRGQHQWPSSSRARPGRNPQILPSGETQPVSPAGATVLATPFLLTALSTSAFIWGRLSLPPYTAAWLSRRTWESRPERVEPRVEPWTHAAGLGGENRPGPRPGTGLGGPALSGCVTLGQSSAPGGGQASGSPSTQ